jgi:mutator protein MutT
MTGTRMEGTADDRSYPRHPLPGILAVLVENGRVLLARRAKEPDSGSWGFPGGLIELGETAAEAARRELAEETGIDAVAERVVDVTDFLRHDSAGRVQYHYILVVMLCRRLAGDPAPASDVAELGWFTPGEAAGLRASPGLDRLIGLALQQSESRLRPPPCDPSEEG